jgi:hypothetical protein
MNDIVTVVLWTVGFSPLAAIVVALICDVVMDYRTLPIAKTLRNDGLVPMAC